MVISNQAILLITTMSVIIFSLLLVSPVLQLASAQNISFPNANATTSTNNIDLNNTLDKNDDMVSSNGTLSLSNNTVSLHTQSVDYHGASNGYLVYPENTSTNETTTTTKLPGVVMIHEWWGLNDNIKNMADELAREGYAVLAVDLYNGQVATTPDQAMQLVSKVREDQNASNANLQSAVKYLASLENVDASNIASLGWCFGGGQSLQLALNSPQEYPLAATVIYYGNLVTDQQRLAEITWPVLGIFGSEDQSIPVSEVKSFEEGLNANNITNEIYIYEGVGHAFANPSGDNFAPTETQDAWQKTIEFLQRNLKQNNQ